jgi:hypothetical protein
MQQALEALEEINKLSIGENAICLPAEIDGAMDALRERLAQPEQEHDDPIGDAQDKLIAEQAARPCKVGGPCVPTQTGPCACKELPPPIGPVVEQPQMQPCAGRNCGSTNPNLHSAECFEDYEKSTGMNQWQGLTDGEIQDLSYLSQKIDESNAAWFDRWGFARAIEQALKEKNHG